VNAATPANDTDRKKVTQESARDYDPRLPWPATGSEMNDQRDGCRPDEKNGKTAQRPLHLGECLVVASLPPFLRLGRPKCAAGGYDCQHAKDRNEGTTVKAIQKGRS